MSTALRTTVAIALQVIATALLIAIFVLLSEKWSPTPLNALWMFGIPIFIGVIANRTTTMKIVMSFELIICAFAAGIVAAGVFGLGP